MSYLNLKNGIKSAFKDLKKAGTIYRTVGRMACYKKIEMNIYQMAIL